MTSTTSSFQQSNRPRSSLGQNLSADWSEHMALILQRALDPSAGDSVFNRRIRALYRRMAADRGACGMDQADFIRQVVAWLKEGPDRATSVAHQDSDVLEHTVCE